MRPSRLPNLPASTISPSRLPGTVGLSRVAGLLVVAGLLLVAATPASAQSPTDFLRALQRGGGWVEIPVEEGRGRLETRSVTTGGLSFRGCTRLWEGNSGQWEIRAEEPVTGRVVEASLGPGDDLPFEHTTGPSARLQVDVRWSEPRDTTLFLWVGLASRNGSPEEACEPR